MEVLEPLLLGAVEADEGEDGQAVDDEPCHELMLNGETLDGVVVRELRLLAGNISAGLRVSMVSLRGTNLLAASTLFARTNRGLPSTSGPIPLDVQSPAATD